MRVLVILLLLANASLFAFTRLDTAGSEAILLQDQVQPDKIKLLTPQQVAALGPGKVAALADVCMEWGPFSEPDRGRALAELEPLQLGRLLSQKRVEYDSGYWVNTGPFASRAAAETRMGELRRQGIRELAVAEAPRGQFAVSFGNFRTEPAAVAYTEELARLGVTLAKVERKTAPVTQTLVVVRDPQQAVVGRMRELAALFPGSELRVAACERPT
ncbi:MAG: SPOR domain-containing protein [Burkholderiales bacterium]|nr:SPOR domain-containing protein [Burkholderiales bacterium]